ncbi:MAG TPA: hypothetical protein ENN41_03135 [Sediminispirochaeta sp.]|nr:hypothetical protein [Sediminispirochaeta sp.]
MASQNTSKNSPAEDKNSINTKQTIGALGGIVVLLGLLFFGVSNTKPVGVEFITDEAKPSQAEYSENASGLEYDDALLKKYEVGTMVELAGKVQQVFEEPIEGEHNMVLGIRETVDTSTDTGKVKQVMLTYVNEPTKEVEKHQQVHVFARYIGTLEFETNVGTSQKVPAVQVDYLEIES